MDWLIDLRPLDDGMRSFEVTPPNDIVAAFGAYLLACAVRGAAENVEGMELRALQAMFVASARGGPFRLEVEETASGASTSVRRVVIGRDAPCAVMTLAFRTTGEGTPDWQGPSKAPMTATPTSLGRYEPTASGLTLVDLRPVDGAPPGYGRIHPVWARPAEPFGDGATAAAAAIALGSDQFVIALAKTPDEDGPAFATTLDHSIWFHRPSHADEWLLYDAELLTLAGRSCVARGTVHSADGRLVASFVQGMLRRDWPRAAEWR